MTKPANSRQSKDHEDLAADVLGGAGALTEALNIIGANGFTDHDMARVIVENERQLRALLIFAIAEIAEQARSQL